MQQKSWKQYLGVCVLVGILLVTATYTPLQAQGLGNRILRRGSTGSDVRELQNILKRLGYTIGNADGVFGIATERGVRSFQRSNRIVVDGIVGAKTKDLLLRAVGRAPATPKSSRGGTNQSDINLLARVVYSEGRGEPYIGQVAIASVVLNRVRHASFPNTISGVVYQPWAFTAVHDGQINLTPNATAFRAARDAMNGWDPSGGATFYYNPRTATSDWIRTRTIIKYIGKHAFCR